MVGLVSHFTLQPVPHVVEPHARQLSVVLLKNVADSVEPLVELVQQRLVLGVIGPLCHHVHVVEGEELELGTNEVVLAGLSGHYVRQLEAIPHLGGPVQTDPQQAEEEHNDNHLKTEDGASSVNSLQREGTATACTNLLLIISACSK